MYENGLRDVLTPAFVVPLLPAHYDASIPPTNGEEYIQRVVWEAANCEEITVSVLDKGQFIINQTPAFEIIPGCEQPPVHLTLSTELQERVVSKFSAVREILAKIKTQESPWRSKVKLPDKNDKHQWIKFCLGTIKRKFVNDQLPEADIGEPPLISTILSMNQPTVEQVLEHHVTLLQSRNSISTQQGRWLYALLAAVEVPLSPDFCFLVRSLARVCAHIRAGMATKVREEADVEAVATSNLFICLVAHYFGQTDLVDS